MLQDYQVGDGPLWVIHIVVGTPWFITQTDSAGCLLRCCRWGSKKHMTQNNNNKKGNCYTNYVERWTWRWGWIPPEVRTEVRDED